MPAPRIAVEFFKLSQDSGFAGLLAVKETSAAALSF
jgi:hypothetical protein